MTYHKILHCLLKSFQFFAADQESDKVELEAFDTVFCKNRNEPLKVGSVVSNVGFCEAASGLTAVAKVYILLNLLDSFS